jgi:hypothetical protein
MLAPEEDTSSLKYLLFLEYAYSAYRTVPELTNAVLHAIRENAAVREECDYYSATSQVESLFRERLVAMAEELYPNCSDRMQFYATQFNAEKATETRLWKTIQQELFAAINEAHNSANTETTGVISDRQHRSEQFLLELQQHAPTIPKLIERVVLIDTPIDVESISYALENAIETHSVHSGSGAKLIDRYIAQGVTLDCKRSEMEM